MNNKLYIAVIVFLLVALACTQFYQSVDSRLHPRPEISRDSHIGLQGSGQEWTLTFTTQVEDVDIALLYYACKFPGGWRIDPVVYDVYPQKGKVKHSRPANCRGRMRVVVKAYNNFRKRTQKQAKMGWEFNLESVIKETAHRI